MSEDPEGWYELRNGEIRVCNQHVFKDITYVDVCSLCKYVITNNPYQQSCGNRICKQCYTDLDFEYYCNACIDDKETEYYHNKANIFLDKARNNDLKKIKVTCPDCKTEDIQFIEIVEHVKNCPNRLHPCPRCHSMIRDEGNHQCKPSTKDSYVSKEMQCPNCNEEVGDIQKHLCSINWDKACPFGCKEISKQTLEEHRESEKLTHLDHVWAILKKNNITNIDDQEAQKNFQREIVQSVKQNLEVGELKKEIRELKESLNEEKKLYADLKQTLIQHLDESELTNYDGTIMWRIDEWNKIKSESINVEADERSRKSIFSPPFFTSRFGYKMCLRLYPNGDQVANGVGISLFLVIMRGKYDDILAWPFKQKVTFMLMDQEFHTNHIDAFVPQEPNISFSKPRTDMNVPAGSSVFIKFEDLNRQGYVKNNCLFIRCIIDCSDLTD